MSSCVAVATAALPSDETSDRGQLDDCTVPRWLPTSETAVDGATVVTARTSTPAEALENKPLLGKSDASAL
jgi:hypothetical protein